MWMLVHKYVEQWLAWLVVDAVSCGIYIYKDLYFLLFYGLLGPGNRLFRLFEVKQLMNLSYEKYKLPMGCDVPEQLFWLIVISFIRWHWSG